MNHYYVYIQQWGNTSMASCYDAYTDNPFLMKQYVKQMTQYLKQSGYVGPVVDNSVREIDVKSEKELISILNRSEIAYSFSEENKLWAIHSEFNGIALVINYATYSKFNETILVSNELTKIDNNFYRLCSPLSINYISKYLTPEASVMLIPMLQLIYEGHRRLHAAIMDRGDYGLLLIDREESELWFIIDECLEVSRFVAMDILKIFKYYSAPFYTNEF